MNISSGKWQVNARQKEDQVTAYKYTNSSYISTYGLQFKAAVFRDGKSMIHFSDSLNNQGRSQCG